MPERIFLEEIWEQEMDNDKKTLWVGLNIRKTELPVKQKRPQDAMPRLRGWDNQSGRNASRI
jgi:hypothetical protein